MIRKIIFSNKNKLNLLSFQSKNQYHLCRQFSSTVANDIKSKNASSSSFQSSKSKKTDDRYQKPKAAKVGAIRTDGRTSRWFKVASIQEVETKLGKQFLVLLDGRIMLTPLNHELMVPTKSLALIIAAEWEKQKKKIQPHTMPMMTMCTTVLDEVPGKRSIIIANLLSFLKSDTACVRNLDNDIAKKQNEILNPLVQWFQQHYNVPLVVESSFMPKEQSDDTIETVQWELFKYDNYQLCALEAMTQSLKSFVLATAIMHQQLSSKDAYNASLIEENINRDQWGKVEGSGGHDVDEADLLQRISAPSALLRFYK